MKKYLYSVLVLIQLLLVGCGSSGGIQDNYKDTFSTPKEAEDNNQITLGDTQIIFVADNQKAMVTAIPAIEQSVLSEKTVNTAHRRPALDAFSLDIMEFIINETGDYDLVLHGGDLLNNSCTWEMDKVSQSLSRSGKPWFVAPGNHDGYYLGISSPLNISKSGTSLKNGVLDERAGWAQICTKPVHLTDGGINGVPQSGRTKAARYNDNKLNVVDKVAFIGQYLEAIGVRSILDGVKKDLHPIDLEGGEYVDYKAYCYSFSEDELHKGYLKDVCWTQYKDNDDFFNDFYPEYSNTRKTTKQWEELTPWRNFLVQKLTVKEEGREIDVLIVDTSSYSYNTAIREKSGGFLIKTNGAADRGHISKAQQKVINQIITANRKLVILGHHPLVDFDDESYQFIYGLFEQGRALRYISGDTHNGYDVKFLSGGSNDQTEVWETNLGSTIDAPIEYAVAGFADSSDSSHHDDFHLKRFSLTPMEKVVNGERIVGDFKQSSKPATNKHYATLNEEVWGGLCEDFRPNSKSMMDPFNTCESDSLCMKSPLTDYHLKAFVLALNQDMRNKNLYAYKVNRLIWLAEIYHKLYDNAGKELPANILNAREVALKSLYGLGGTGYWKEFFSKDQQNYYIALVRLSELIELFEKDIEQSNDLPITYKLCSALFDAETEYKTSFLEKLSIF